MHESSIVRYFTEKAVAEGFEQGIEIGIQEGRRAAALASLLTVLEVRFHPRGVQILKPALEAIEDAQHLRQLLLEAVQVPTLEEFAAYLVSSANEAR